MSYQVFPLMHYTPGDVEEGEPIMIASAPFAGKITKIHARLDGGTCKTMLKIGTTTLPATQMLVALTTASLTPQPPIPVSDSEPIELLIITPISARNLYVQLTIERL